MKPDDFKKLLEFLSDIKKDDKIKIAGGLGVVVLVFKGIDAICKILSSGKAEEISESEDNNSVDSPDESRDNGE